MKYVIEIELPGSFTGTEELAGQGNKMSAWDFVGAFLPGYEHRDDVAENDDLQKIVDEEEEDGDCASDLLRDEYKGNRKGAESDLQASNAKLYEEAIEGFIASIKSVKEVVNG